MVMHGCWLLMLPALLTSLLPTQIAQMQAGASRPAAALTQPAPAPQAQVSSAVSPCCYSLHDLCTTYTVIVTYKHVDLQLLAAVSCCRQTSGIKAQLTCKAV